MKVCEVLPVYEEIQHIKALAADLESGLNPIDCRLLEELSLLQRLQQILPLERPRLLLVQFVQHIWLEELLVRHADFDRLFRGDALEIPLLDQRHIFGSHHAARSAVERERGPPQLDSSGRDLGCQLYVSPERLQAGRQLKRLSLWFVVASRAEQLVLVAHRDVLWRNSTRGDRIDTGVKMECWQARVVGKLVHHLRVRVPIGPYTSRSGVVQIRICNPRFRTNRVPEYDAVYSIELAKILVVGVYVLVLGFETGTAGERNVKRLRSDEALGLKKIKVVLVDDIAQQRATEPMQSRHLG